MKVYIVKQAEKTRWGKPSGPNRIRGVFSTKQKAEEHIGPRENKYIRCETCGTKHVNKKADLDADGNTWKDKLFIDEYEVE